jgi:predicted HAD superfamily phosphohydrolase YqeG
MRRRYIQIGGVLYEKGTEPMSSLHIIPDIKPYKSMIDGTWITSRSQHREHLKAHNCIEIGDQIPTDPKEMKSSGIPDIAPQQRKDFIAHQFSSMTDAEVRQMLRRDVQNVRWNSRKD